jgi:signal transduction histidine kinase
LSGIALNFIVNLIINAIQAITELAPVARSISIRTILSDRDTVCCSIEDSGAGIDPEHLPRLFDGFFTTKDTGMGMGLAICRSIVEAHGGGIRADNNSTLGGGRVSLLACPRRTHNRPMHAEDSSGGTLAACGSGWFATGPSRAAAGRSVLSLA